jgi:hypothetical protein
MIERKESVIPPECGATLERIQSVLDGIHPPFILDMDAHPASCDACRQRVRAARLLLQRFAEPSSIVLPADFTSSTLSRVKRDRIARARKKGLLLAASFMAVAVSLVIWGAWSGPKNVAMNVPELNPVAPRGSAPTPPPIRVNDELAKAGEALRESTRTITEPAASTPRVFAAITDSLFKAPAAPAAFDLGPAGKSLSEIPDAARTGLEPVTGTAQKAFNRLLRDVSVLQPKMKS